MYVSPPGGVPAPEAKQSSVYVLEDTVVQPKTVQAFAVKVAEVEKGRMPGGDGFVNGSVSFMEATDLHPWRGVLIGCEDDGRAMVGAMNSLDEPITIKNGTRYGEFTRACTEEERAKMPWRICAMGASGEDVGTDKGASRDRRNGNLG
jgi:hypothetical protein